MLIKKIINFGKARANQYATPTNNLKLVAEDAPVSAMDIINVGVQSGDFIVSIDFNGVTYRTDSPIVDLEGRQVHNALGALDFSNATNLPKIVGWLHSIASIYEVDPYIEIELVGSELHIFHVGNFAFDNVVTDRGAQTAITRCTDYANFNQFKLFIEGAVTGINWNNGTEQALPNSPYSYTGNSTTDEATAATLQTDVETALTTLGVPNLQDVKVRVDTIAGAFEVSYWTTSNEPAIVDGKRFVSSDADVRFTCDIPSLGA